MPTPTATFTSPPSRGGHDSLTIALGSLTNAELAALDNEALLTELARTARAKEALCGREAQLGGEIARREAFRDEGATSLESYLAGHLGHSNASARAIAHVGERLFDLPELQGALSSGRLSFDQVRALVDVARPEDDAEWAERAQGLSVREVAELARRAPASKARRKKPEGPPRPTLRCHDATSTLVASLPAADYVELKGTLEARAKAMAPDEAELSHDERMGLALMSLGRGGVASAGRGGPAPVVVAHVRLEALLAEDHDSSALVGELERGGLISAEVLERLACDATLIVGVDDEAGHTMYEGRATRFPSETQRRELWRRDRHCRFPGCANALYTNAHHIVGWTPAGTTDLDNLVTLCRHHHHEVHSKRWKLSGDANVELTFVGAGGKTMTSRPSPLWGNPVPDG
jgi:hypothetical protein